MKRLEIPFEGEMIGVKEEVISPEDKEKLIKELESLLNSFLKEKKEYIGAIKKLYRKYEKCHFEKNWKERLKDILTDWKGYVMAIVINVPLIIATKRIDLCNSLWYLITALGINVGEEFIENLSGEIVDEIEERKKKKEFIERNIEKIIRCIGDKHYERISEIVNELLENYVDSLNIRELKVILKAIRDFLIPYTSIVPELYLDYQRYVQMIKYVNNLIYEKKRWKNIIKVSNYLTRNDFSSAYLQVII